MEDYQIALAALKLLGTPGQLHDQIWDAVNEMCVCCRQMHADGEDAHLDTFMHKLAEEIPYLSPSVQVDVLDGLSDHHVHSHNPTLRATLEQLVGSPNRRVFTAAMMAVNWVCDATPGELAAMRDSVLEAHRTLLDTYLRRIS